MNVFGILECTHTLEEVDLKCGVYEWMLCKLISISAFYFIIYVILRAVFMVEALTFQTHKLQNGIVIDTSVKVFFSVNDHCDGSPLRVSL